jgi:hypothetical protein
MKFVLDAWVTSDSPEAIGRFLADKLGAESVRREGNDWIVRGKVDGRSAREANRTLVAQLRRIERKTQLRAAWTHGGLTERFLDYVPKGQLPADP